MLLECVLAIITLCAIAYARETGHVKGATDIFAGGIAAMIGAIPGLESMERSMYTLLVLTYSAFCLTSWIPPPVWPASCSGILAGTGADAERH